MSDDAFEKALRDDLPRGHGGRGVARGIERGLFARWLKPDEMTGKTWDPDGGLLLGKRGGRNIGWNDDRHVMTIAGSRAGKGISLIGPNLMLYKGSALVIDPKGELARLTARRRGAGAEGGRGGLGQDVYVLDPFGVSGLKSAAFNPLSELDLDSPDLIDDVTMFADALIIHNERGDRHWTESAHALLSALILLVVADPDRDNRTLIAVRRLLTLDHPRITNRIKWQPQDEIKEKGKMTEQVALLRLLSEQDGPHAHVCRGVAAQLQAMAEKELGSVLSTARTQTQWLDSTKIEPVLSKSDFQLADLKRKKTTIYLSLPATRLGTHARWLRLMILLAITVMERVDIDIDPPVLFVLDEFPVLGHMDSIEKAAGLMAGFGVKLWVILQNVGQLKQHYDKSWETFFANCGAITAFGVADNETLKTLSDALGRMGIVERVPSAASDHALRQGAPSQQDDRREVPLLAPHELRLAFGRKKKRVLIFNAEDNPAVAERFVYYSEEDRALFEGLYDADPKYARRADAKP
jgi:type IV secretion system protein VirD4